MRITSIELVRYKRFMLNNIEKFVLKPNQIVQIILGTNGSGKSSLIKELSPLPPDPNDYFKDGSKTVKIADAGNTYVLKSVFSPSNKHSFEKNGEELNPGGTITVQKELVRQEFRYTAEIHELATGQEKFHDMSPSRRREWFTMLSDVDYDYALGVYQRLKERSRDLTGALRTAKKRLVTESSKVISPAEEAKLRQDVELTLRELNILIEQSAPLDRPVETYRQEQEAGLEELTRLSTRLLRMRCVAPYGAHPYGVDPRRPVERDEWGETLVPGFESVEQIDDLLNSLRHQITAREALINKAVTEHSKIEETVQILVKTGAEGVKALQERLQMARVSRDSFLAQRKLGIEGVDAPNATSALGTVYDVLAATFSVMPENEEKRFSRTRLQELQEKLLISKNETLRLTQEFNALVAKKNHLESHKSNGSTACPKCNHTWIIGYSDERLQELLQHIAKKDEEVKANNLIVAEIEVEIAAIQEYSNHYREYMGCVRNWPVLRPLWDYLEEGGYVLRSPRKALSIVDVFRTDLQHELDAGMVEKDIHEIMTLIASAEQVGDANLSEMRLKLEESTHAIEQMTAELTKLQTSLAEYGKYRAQMVEALALGEKISGLMTFMEKTNSDMIEMVRRETLNHCVRQLQHSLAIKQETLSAAIIQKSIIEDLEKQIATLTVDEQAAKLLVFELSPTDGLIAEGLLGFIRKFVSQMNTLIRKIWSYPLQVLDCGMASESRAELDYKFPMMVQTKSNVVADVKMGSSGMREIVDLAFKVTAMSYLHLSESPLSLDEFGASFDETHRNAATHAIKNLMEQKPFTQLFMVSHYESSYGAFTNAEICVLCPSNITVPVEAKYNQHVSIT